MTVTPARCVDPLLVAAIRVAHRQRQDYLRPAKALASQIKAMERRIKADRRRYSERTVQPSVRLDASDDLSLLLVTSHLAAHRDELQGLADACQSQIEKMAKQLPVWPWVESVRGASALGLGQIVAEVAVPVEGGVFSTLDNYANPAKVWKRFGLGEVDGQRQRRVKDRALAVAMGYNPRRRSIAHVLADSLMKQNRGEYREVYDDAKAAKLALDWTLGHAHMHGMRLLAKRYLRNLWVEWRACSSKSEPQVD